MLQPNLFIILKVVSYNEICVGFFLNFFTQLEKILDCLDFAVASRTPVHHQRELLLCTLMCKKKIAPFIALFRCNHRHDDPSACSDMPRIFIFRCTFFEANLLKLTWKDSWNILVNL